MNKVILNLYQSEIENKCNNIFRLVKTEHNIQLLVKLIGIELESLVYLCSNYGRYIGEENV